MTVTDRPIEELPSWSLSSLYDSIDDPRIMQDMQGQLERAKRFADSYRGRIAVPGLTPELLLEAVREYEEIYRLANRPQTYAHLVYTADTSDPRHGALVQLLLERGSEITNTLIFFELEICALDDEQYATLIADDRLAVYRHYLDKEREMRPHRLSEPEEKILEEKANSGKRAFRRLFDETLSNHTFRVTLTGETQELPEARVLALLYEPDREARKAGAEALTAGLRENARTLGMTFNALLLDKWTDDRLRRFDQPETSRHLANELTSEVVETVSSACVGAFPLVAEYYRLKGKLLGIHPLTHYDRYAPLEKAATKIPYAQAQEMVLRAFGQFSPEVHDAASRFFEDSRIDAAIRTGKQGGAFCCSVDHERPPFVLMNYTERPRDVMTLAHELGHGVHGCLAQRQTFLNYRPVLPLAETASVFGEILVFERLLEQLPTDRERLALLCERIEDTIATTFRQISLYRFEQRVHRARRERGELTVDAISEIWQQSIQEMFGDSVELGDDHACWWMYIPHFIHSPFYVYAYSVGELLVLSLYARYRSEGEAFVPRYLELLGTGGSRRPREILADLEINIEDRGFWEGGLALISNYIRQAQELSKSLPDLMST